MSLTFEIKGDLPEHAIRHIVREAEGLMANCSDAKAALVQAAQGYLAEQHAIDIKAAIDAAQEMAAMIGCDDYLEVALADVKAQIGANFDKVMDVYAGGPTQHLADALAKAVVEAKPVPPGDRGKWLAKIGIVKEHIDALTPAVAETVDGDADTAVVLDADTSGVIEQRPFSVASADGAAVHPLTSADVPNVAPLGLDAPPPPPAVSPRDAYVLFGEALKLNDDVLAKRLGVSRSTVRNYLNGKTANLKVTLAQARFMVAEIDLRIAKLRQAAEIFSQVRD